MNVLLLGRTSEARQALHHMLTARGHDVIVTDNHDIFWAEFIRDTYPMIFLDLSIAGYPELHLCQRIRSTPRENQSLIIVYGLRGQEVHADLLVDAGVDEYLSLDGDQVEELDNRVILFEHHARLSTIRQQAVAATQTVYERLFHHLAASPLAVVEWDHDLRALHWSQGAARLFGWKASDVVGKNVMDWPFVHEEDTAEVFHCLSALVDGLDERVSHTRRALTSSGDLIVAEWHTSVARDVSGQFVSAVTFAVDVTQRAQAFDALNLSERRLHALVQNTADIILTIDADGLIDYVSPSVERTLGYAPAPIPGGTIFAFIHPDDQDRVRETLTSLAESPGVASPTTEFRISHNDGSWRHVEALITNLVNDPAIGSMILVAHDVSDHKQLERQLTRQAFFDSLTGLPNRALFLNRLSHALARVERGPNSIAVLFVDLDRFKLVNDSLGHHVGDALLATLGRLLREHVRPGDTVARLAGDEFTILLEDMSSAAEAVRVAERILEALHFPLQLGDHEVFAMASIGLAFADLSARTPEDLMRNADAALYRAKATGKGRYVVFDDSLAGQAVERLALETELRSALPESQLLIHYQPEIDLNTSAITGFEALVRWQHPRRGIVYPEEFLEAASESGSIVPIGQWVLTEACRTATTWRIPQGDGLLPSVHVNLTGSEFKQPQFVELMRSVLADSGLDPTRLKLEVVESVIAQGDSNTLLQLRQLSELGVRIVIDNFGSGYSSLSMLAQLTAETIKIDRTFVSGQNSLTSNLSIIRAITSLAHAFGMDVVAQGIETQEQKIRVTSAGCNRGQGNYLYPPMDADDVQALLSLAGDPP
ncbi:hypothetical protein BH23CHL1_BH23CHL1_08780 [soil metagenome]